MCTQDKVFNIPSGSRRSTGDSEPLVQIGTDTVFGWWLKHQDLRRDHCNEIITDQLRDNNTEYHPVATEIIYSM